MRRMYTCPNCRGILERRNSHCRRCWIPLSWLRKNGKLPNVDNYRFLKEGWR